MRDWRGRDRERKQENIKDTDQEINKKIKLFRMKQRKERDVYRQ